MLQLAVESGIEAPATPARAMAKLPSLRGAKGNPISQILASRLHLASHRHPHTFYRAAHQVSRASPLRTGLWRIDKSSLQNVTHLHDCEVMKAIKFSHSLIAA